MLIDEQTDRKLLELAAQAAGYSLSEVNDMIWSDAEAEYVHWNPLTDDGDALRLAVKVLNWPHGGRAFDSAVSTMYAVGQLPSDPYTATRRAIVRATAEIGRSME